MTDYKSLFKNKNFVLLWLSQLLSQFSVNLLNFVIITSLYKSTGSAIAVSLVWISYAIPIVVLGPIASAGVDILDKKRILIITNLLQASTIFLYAYAFGVSVFLLYGLVLLYSVFNQFYVPAELASVPFLVKKKNLAQANSMFFITQQSAVIFGFGIASILLSFMGFRDTLFVSSAMLFLAFVSVSLIKGVRLNSKKHDIEKSFSTFFKHILEGYRYIKRDKNVLAPLGLIVGLQIALAISFTNLPLLAEEFLNTPIEYAGLLVVMPGGVGAAIAAYLVPKLLKRYRKLHVIKHSLQLMVLALLILNFAGEPLIIFSYLSVIALGFSFVGVYIPSQTFLQEHTPDKLRGRVFGNLWLLTTLFTIVPLIISASFVEIFGVRILIFFIGAAVLSVYIFLHRYGEKLMYSSSPGMR